MRHPRVFLFAAPTAVECPAVHEDVVVAVLADDYPLPYGARIRRGVAEQLVSPSVSPG